MNILQNSSTHLPISTSDNFSVLVLSAPKEHNENVCFEEGLIECIEIPV
jgi:hypothetical protein